MILKEIHLSTQWFLHLILKWIMLSHGLVRKYLTHYMKRYLVKMDGSQDLKNLSFSILWKVNLIWVLIIYLVVLVKMVSVVEDYSLMHLTNLKMYLKDSVITLQVNRMWIVKVKQSQIILIVFLIILKILLKMHTNQLKPMYLVVQKMKMEIQMRINQ